jgi:hypothetical protein
MVDGAWPLAEGTDAIVAVAQASRIVAFSFEPIPVVEFDLYQDIRFVAWRLAAVHSVGSTGMPAARKPTGFADVADRGLAKTKRLI